MAGEGLLSVTTAKGKKPSRKMKQTVTDPNTGYALGKKTYKAIYRNPESGNVIYKETKYTPASKKKSSGISAGKANKGGRRMSGSSGMGKAPKGGLNCAGGGASGKGSKSCGPDSKKKR